MNAPDKIDPETGEISSREMAAEFLLGELIKAASKRFKALAVPYMDLKQHEQATLMREIDADIRRVVLIVIEDGEEQKSGELLDGENGEEPSKPESAPKSGRTRGGAASRPGRSEARAEAEKAFE